MLSLLVKSNARRYVRSYLATFHPSSPIARRYPHINDYYRHLLETRVDKAMITDQIRLLKENAHSPSPYTSSQRQGAFIASSIAGGGIGAGFLSLLWTKDQRPTENKEAEEMYLKFMDQL